MQTQEIWLQSPRSELLCLTTAQGERHSLPSVHQVIPRNFRVHPYFLFLGKKNPDSHLTKLVLESHENENQGNQRVIMKSSIDIHCGNATVYPVH